MLRADGLIITQTGSRVFFPLQMWRLWKSKGRVDGLARLVFGRFGESRMIRAQRRGLSVVYSCRGRAHSGGFVGPRGRPSDYPRFSIGQNQPSPVQHGLKSCAETWESLGGFEPTTVDERRRGESTGCGRECGMLMRAMPPSISRAVPTLSRGAELLPLPLFLPCGENVIRI